MNAAIKIYKARRTVVALNMQQAAAAERQRERERERERERMRKTEGLQSLSTTMLLQR
jgi:hypothetical protein